MALGSSSSSFTGSRGWYSPLKSHRLFLYTSEYECRRRALRRRRSAHSDARRNRMTNLPWQVQELQDSVLPRSRSITLAPAASTLLFNIKEILSRHSLRWLHVSRDSNIIMTFFSNNFSQYLKSREYHQ
jgi:hypothetical protein